MKIAITSEGNTLEAQIDRRFGRCAFFAIYDTDTQTTDFFPNPAKDFPEGAGPAAVQFVVSKGIKKVVAAEFGAKVKPLFDKLQIEMINESGKPISEIIRKL